MINPNDIIQNVNYRSRKGKFVISVDIVLLTRHGLISVVSVIVHVPLVFKPSFQSSRRVINNLLSETTSPSQQRQIDKLIFSLKNL